MEETHQHANGSYFCRMGFLGDHSFMPCFHVVLFVCNEHSLLVKLEITNVIKIEKNNIVNCSHLCACLCVCTFGVCRERQISIGQCLSVKYITIPWNLGFSNLKNVIKVF